MGRWAREREYDALVGASVDSVAATMGPWAPLSRDGAVAAVKAIIAKESAFNPAAVRGEPHLGDTAASVGLMQLLYTTARGLGYPGLPGSPQGLTGLFDPGTNIYLGTKYLWVQLSRAGNLDGAFSAYNGDYRPRLGFGVRRTTATPRVCLRWKAAAPKTGRIINRDCEVVGSTVPGTFSNQSYVDRARNYYAYFFGPGPLPAGGPKPPNAAPTG